jgi:predicted secreted Zn-dependent protease
MIRFLLSIVVLSITCGNAWAAPSDKSQIAYFPVNGKTAKEIHDNIKVAAPKVGRGAVYAFTIPAVKHVKSLRKAKDSCSFITHQSLAYYTFVLPKLATSKGVSARVLTDWRSFEGYLRVHEEGHRTIWRKCLADYDLHVLKLKAKTCEALEKANAQLFNRVKLRCVEEDEKYDFAFRKDVFKQPFVKSALGR